jgi:hypothetical protein
MFLWCAVRSKDLFVKNSGLVSSWYTNAGIISLEATLRKRKSRYLGYYADELRECS